MDLGEGGRVGWPFPTFTAPGMWLMQLASACSPVRSVKEL